MGFIFCFVWVFFVCLFVVFFVCFFFGGGASFVWFHLFV